MTAPADGSVGTVMADPAGVVHRVDWAREGWWNMGVNSRRGMRCACVGLLAAAVYGVPAQAQVVALQGAVMSDPAAVGTQGGAGSRLGAVRGGRQVSSDGRYLVFESDASTLVAGDTNGVSDVFVRDLWLGVVERVSVGTTGGQGLAASRAASISATGRYVVFEAVNGFDATAVAHADVYLHDRETGLTERVSRPQVAGIRNFSGGPSVSSDGRFVAFSSSSSDLVASDTNIATDVFVHDRQTGSNRRVSVSSVGGEGNQNSSGAMLSDDGGTVVFSSLASNLVGGDTNGVSDVFMLVLSGSVPRRISRNGSLEQGNGASSAPQVSSDGSVIVFQSTASNLVANDTNARVDVFVYRPADGVPERVSVQPDGTQGNGDSTEPALSPDGRWVAFTSRASSFSGIDSNGQPDVYLRDLGSAPGNWIEHISVDVGGGPINGPAQRPTLAADGTQVWFDSVASTLVRGDGNAASDVFQRDRLRRETVLQSRGNGSPVPNAAAQLPGLDGSGQLLVFDSAAGNLVPDDDNGDSDVFVRDLVAGTVERISRSFNADRAPSGPSFEGAISADGRWVAYASEADNIASPDNNATRDVFLYDRQTGASRLLSRGLGGSAGQGSSSLPSVSGDGGRVVFHSWADDLVPGDTNGRADVFLYDRDSDSLRRVSVDSSGAEVVGDSTGARISGDGRWVAFVSDAPALAPGDALSQHDVYLHDLETGLTTRLSSTPAGLPSSGVSAGPVSLSADGRRVVFASAAADLVPGDGNNRQDVFLYERGVASLRRLSRPAGGGEADAQASAPVLSADGRVLAFHSEASNYVAGDNNALSDVFLLAIDSGEWLRVSEDRLGTSGGGFSRWPAINGDGRRVAFESVSTNWTLDAGVQPQHNSVFVASPRVLRVFSDGFE